MAPVHATLLGLPPRAGDGIASSSDGSSHAQTRLFRICDTVCHETPKSVAICLLDMVERSVLILRTLAAFSLAVHERSPRVVEPAAIWSLLLSAIDPSARWSTLTQYGTLHAWRTNWLSGMVPCLSSKTNLWALNAIPLNAPKPCPNFDRIPVQGMQPDGSVGIPEKCVTQQPAEHHFERGERGENSWSHAAHARGFARHVEAGRVESNFKRGRLGARLCWRMGFGAARSRLSRPLSLTVPNSKCSGLRQRRLSHLWRTINPAGIGRSLAAIHAARWASTSPQRKRDRPYPESSRRFCHSRQSPRHALPACSEHGSEQNFRLAPLDAGIIVSQTAHGFGGYKRLARLRHASPEDASAMARG